MDREEYWELVKEIARELGIEIQEARQVVRGIRWQGEVREHG